LGASVSCQGQGRAACFTPKNRGVDEFAAVTDVLERDPLLAMSLSSRELFHSNLLAWFLEHSLNPFHPGYAP
jgi:hypothetical protein